MKSMFAAVAASILIGSTAQAAGSSIKIYKNYDPETRRHDGAVTSTLSRPLSLGLVFASVNEDAKPNAACFSGEPEAAAKILEAMLDVMNREEGKSVTIESTQIVKRVVRTGDKERVVSAIKLELSEVFQGQTVTWQLFPSGIRPCR